MHRSGISAAGLNTDSLRDTCSDAPRDTAMTLRRLVFSYQRSARDRSLLRFGPLRKSKSALHSTIASSTCGPCREFGPDHLDRTICSDEIRRPRQVEPPLQIGAARRPQAEVSALTDNVHCDVLVREVREGDQSLPAAPAGRLRGWCADDLANHRVQAIRTN